MLAADLSTATVAASLLTAAEIAAQAGLAPPPPTSSPAPAGTLGATWETSSTPNGSSPSLQFTPQLKQALYTVWKDAEEQSNLSPQVTAPDGKSDGGDALPTPQFGVATAGRGLGVSGGGAGPSSGGADQLTAPGGPAAPLPDFKLHLMPVAAETQVTDSFGPQPTEPNVYQIPIDDRTERINIKFVGHDRLIEDLVAVLDAVGENLAFTRSGPNSLSLDLSVAMPAWGGRSAVFVMVAPLLSAGGASGSDGGYTIQISREERSNSAGSTPTELVPVSPVSAPSQVNSRASSQELSEGSSSASTLEDPDTLGAAGTLTSGVTRPVVVAVGPLPRRSAAPLGGILADGDPTPSIDPDHLAQIDLGLLLRGPGAGEGKEAGDLLADAPGVGRGDDGGAFEPMRGPGGIPLLATALLATPRPLVSDARASARVETPWPVARPVGEGSEAEYPPRPPVCPARAAAAGTVLASTLLCGLVLPDLAGPPFPDEEDEDRPPRWRRLWRRPRRGDA